MNAPTPSVFGKVTRAYCASPSHGAPGSSQEVLDLNASPFREKDSTQQMKIVDIFAPATIVDNSDIY